MKAKEVVDAAFEALIHDDRGWHLTDKGLATLEHKLEASVAAGTFSACAFEMRGLMGFLADQGDADRALQQLNVLSAKFKEHLQTKEPPPKARTPQDAHDGDPHGQGERGAAFLGARSPRKARAHDAPKQGLSLSDIAPYEALRDPRSYAPKHKKKK